MDLFLLALLVAGSAWVIKQRDQRRRIALLGRHLAKYQIEKHMEALTLGYLRALVEADLQRSGPIWNMLHATEQELCSQFGRFVAAFARTQEADTRVSKLPVWLPFAAKLLPGLTFDMREALAIHGRGIRQAVEAIGGGLSPRTTAFTLSAELFLMQHTCHWFCKSRAVASARMLVRHKTSYDQLVASVSPETRAAYCDLIGRR